MTFQIYEKMLQTTNQYVYTLSLHSHFCWYTQSPVNTERSMAGTGPLLWEVSCFTRQFICQSSRQRLAFPGCTFSPTYKRSRAPDADGQVVWSLSETSWTDNPARFLWDVSHTWMDARVGRCATSGSRVQMSFEARAATGLASAVRWRR